MRAMDIDGVTPSTAINVEIAVEKIRKEFADDYSVSEFLKVFETLAFSESMPRHELEKRIEELEDEIIGLEDEIYGLEDEIYETKALLREVLGNYE